MRNVLVLVLSVLSSVSFAQAPAKLGYQGRLLKADGSPEAGVVPMAFALYASEAGGAALWTEAQQIAVSDDGFYSTFLGSVTPLALDTFDGKELFLELRVRTETLSPRQRVASVAYALRADTSRNVSGGTVDASSVSIAGATVLDGAGHLAGPAAAQFSSPGTLNASTNPVDWTRLKGVPSFVENQTAVAQDAGFSVSGAGTVGALAVNGDARVAGALDVGLVFRTCPYPVGATEADCSSRLARR